LGVSKALAMPILCLDEQRADNAIKLPVPEKALASLEQALTIAISNKHRASSIASHKKALAEFKAKQG